MKPDNLMDDNWNILAGNNDLNGMFNETQTNTENINYGINKKYRGNEDTSATKDVKFEGVVKVEDPLAFNDSATDLADAKSPGVFILGTRAFSSDNNPWVESTADSGNADSKLTTESEEVSIGELAFLDGNNSMVITGIDNDVSTVSGVVASSFTHKIPIQVQDGSGNKESYYLLVSTS